MGEALAINRIGSEGNLVSPSLQSCIQDSTECAELCGALVTHCLQKGDEFARPEFINSLLDCVDICSTNARLLARESEFRTGLCALCVEVVEHCADLCAVLEADEEMQQCEEICRRCAQACRSLAY